jgi:hypothetical protein
MGEKWVVVMAKEIGEEVVTGRPDKRRLRL